MSGRSRRLQKRYLGGSRRIWGYNVALISVSTHSTYICTLKLCSMNLRDTVVKYVTSSIDVEFDTKFTVQHEMAYEIEYELLTDPEELTVKYGGGSYSISGFKMTLQRRKSSFVANFFFPSFLIVLTAFVSFWVPPASIPGRGWVHRSSLSD